MSRSRNSNNEIWNIFERNRDSRVAECNLCKKKLSYKTSISNLKQHLRIKHISVYNKYLARVAERFGSSYSRQEKPVQQGWDAARDAYVKNKDTSKTTQFGSGDENKNKFVNYDPLENTIDGPLSNSVPSLGRHGTDDDEPNLSSPKTSQQKNLPPRTSNSQMKEKKAQRERKHNEDEGFEREMLKMFKENTKLMQNDDMQFFCSLLPITRTFTNHQKLLFRSEVLKKAMKFCNNSKIYRSRDKRPGSVQSVQESVVSAGSRGSEVITLYSGDESEVGTERHSCLVVETTSQHHNTPAHTSRVRDGLAFSAAFT